MRADVLRVGIECGADGCRGFGNTVGVGSFATSLLVLAGLLVVLYVAIFVAMELGAAAARLSMKELSARIAAPAALGTGLRWAPDAPGGPGWIDQGSPRTAGAGEASA